ncbi:hypothetical protein LINPERPRIM_LOCUS31692 [Linum perenne]
MPATTGWQGERQEEAHRRPGLPFTMPARRTDALVWRS